MNEADIRAGANLEIAGTRVLFKAPVSRFSVAADGRFLTDDPAGADTPVVPELSVIVNGRRGSGSTEVSSGMIQPRMNDSWPAAPATLKHERAGRVSAHAAPEPDTIRLAGCQPAPQVFNADGRGLSSASHHFV
jgi:hypothetical protein